MNRRSLLFGLGASLIAAPAIVRAASLMPVRGLVMPTSGAITLSHGDWGWVGYSVAGTHGYEVGFGRYDPAANTLTRTGRIDAAMEMTT